MISFWKIFDTHTQFSLYSIEIRAKSAWKRDDPFWINSVRVKSVCVLLNVQLTVHMKSGRRWCIWYLDEHLIGPRACLIELANGYLIWEWNKARNISDIRRVTRVTSRKTAQPPTQSTGASVHLLQITPFIGFFISLQENLNCLMIWTQALPLQTPLSLTLLYYHPSASLSLSLDLFVSIFLTFNHRHLLNLNNS